MFDLYLCRSNRGVVDMRHKKQGRDEVLVTLASHTRTKTHIHRFTHFLITSFNFLMVWAGDDFVLPRAPTLSHINNTLTETGRFTFFAHTMFTYNQNSRRLG